MFQDLRIGLRMLLKDKGFTVVAALTLALGIGANTAMFSVLNTYLFRALPYPNSDRLVRVFRTSIHSQSWPHSPGNFFAQREKNNVFDKMVAYSFNSPNLAEPGEPAARLHSRRLCDHRTGRRRRRRRPQRPFLDEALRRRLERSRAHASIGRAGCEDHRRDASWIRSPAAVGHG